MATPLHLEIGPVAIDIPETVGYYGGITVAVALGVIEPPLGAFIAAIPLIKMLATPGLPAPLQFTGRLLQGAAKPVGSDGQGTLRLADPPRAERSIERN